MIKSTPQLNNTTHLKGKLNNKENSQHSKNLPLMCKAAIKTVNQLYNPIDAINRFINLALHSLEEGSQNRQFLIDSKRGIRKTSLLLRRLTNYTKRIEREVSKIKESESE